MRSQASAQGFGLVEVMVSLAVVNILVAALMSTGAVTSKLQAQSNTTFQADTARRSLMQLLNNATAWGNTIADANNSSACPSPTATCNPLSCLGSPGTCYSGQGGNIFVVRDSTTSPGMQFYDWLGNDGLTPQGSKCGSFSAAPGTGSDNCPMQFQISWVASCNQPTGTLCGSSAVQPQITIQLMYNPGTAARTIALNTANYGATFFQGAGTVGCTWINNASGLVETCGNVGIGTTAPTAALTVNGQVVAGVFDNGAGTSFDFNNGNVQYTSASCGALVLSNTVDGGTYTVVVNGTTAGTCTFSSGGITAFRYNFTGSTVAGTRSVFNLQRIGTEIFVSWSSGFQ